jgi:ABC-type sugar transport system substrate-binding protein
VIQAPRMIPSSEIAGPVSSFARIVLFILAFVGCVGCKREQPDSRSPKPQVTRVAILADNLSNPMRNYQTTLLERLVRTRPRMEVSTVNAGGDAAVQSRQVRDAVSAGAAFIMVFPQDAEALAPALRDALSAGARVFAFSNNVPENACTSAIFTEESELGRVAGEYVVTALKAKAESESRPAVSGRVVMLRGDEESRACRERAEGFLSVIQSVPEIVLVHDAPANWIEQEGADRIREALRIQKQFDVIYAQNDFMAAGASKAVRESGTGLRESMLVVGTDGVPGKGAGVAMVINGELDATVYHPPLVDAAWQEMQALLDDAKTQIRKRILVKPFMITPENASSLQLTGLPSPVIEP